MRTLRPIFVAALAVVVLATGSVAGLALSGQFSASDRSAAQKQYCPPQSQNGQGGGNKGGDKGKGKKCGKQGTKGERKSRSKAMPRNKRLRGKRFPGAVRYQSRGTDSDSHGAYRRYRIRYRNGRLESWRYYPNYDGKGPRWVRGK